MPDLAEYPASFFPAWSEHCLLDIALAPAVAAPQVRPYLFVPEAFQSLLQPVALRRGPSVTTVSLGNDRSDLMAALRQVKADVLILGPTAETALFELPPILEDFASGPLNLLELSPKEAAQGLAETWRQKNEAMKMFGPGVASRPAEPADSGEHTVPPAAASGADHPGLPG